MYDIWFKTSLGAKPLFNKFDYAEGLYFCGSSTHPGAGVPIVMQSAKLAVEELLKDDR